MPDDKGRIPVTVLTGFLGAGKTTVLNRLLRDPALADTAVVINEFGEVGIDHLLVERTGEDVVLLAAGCLCCTIRGELVDTLSDLAERRLAGALPPFRRLVIETTGLADPLPILQTLVVHDGLSAAYRLDAVVTVVDAATGEGTLDRHAEAATQVAVADRLVLAKLDLAEANPAALEHLRQRLHALNPGAPQLDGRTASVLDILAAGSDDAAARIASLRSWLGDGHRDDANDGHGHHDRGSHHHDSHDHDSHDHAASGNGGPDVNRHDDRIVSFSLTTDEALPAGRLAAFLDLVRDRHGPNLLRMKAVVRTVDQPERPLILHAVQHILHPPERLAAWPDADRRSRLVFIMRDTDPSEVEELFAAFTGRPRPDRPDAAALRDNPLALRRG